MIPMFDIKNFIGEPETTYGFDEFASFHKFYNKDDKLLFNLDRDLMYRAKDGTVYVVKKETKPSDLGSVPPLLWFIAPPHEFPSAYFLHDYLCGLVNKGEFSRLKADQLLREALQASHCPAWKVHFLYSGVRIGAFFSGKRG